MLDARLNPAPHSFEESVAFAELQASFPDIYRSVFDDPKAPRTVVVVPSATVMSSR